MLIQQLCDKIMQPHHAMGNRLRSDVSASGVSLLFGRPSIGKTTLSFQIAGEAAKAGTVLFFSMELSRAMAEKRMQELQIADAPIIIEDAPHIKKAKILSLARQHPDASLIILDYLQLFNGDICDLADIYEQTGIPVMALSQLHRGAEDNPNHEATYSDIVWQLVKYHDITLETLKAVRKFCINRSHKRERNRGNAVSCDHSNKTLLYEYDANGLFAEYDLLWDPE